MKIKFDTKPGVDTKKWECLIAATCTPESETFDDLLAEGWLFDPISLQWYMSRSVRINLAHWEMSDSATKATRLYRWKNISALSNDDEDLLVSYRRERGFMNYTYDTFPKLGAVCLERGESELGNCWYMVVHCDTVSVYPGLAFKRGGTKTSPGKACLARACQASKDRGSSHLYLYEGYGAMNSYKADCSGFEWWDGSRWSRDKETYLDCLREDGSF